MKKALALDIGGTKIYSAIIDELGNILSEVQKHSTDKTLESLHSTIRKIIAEYENEVDVIAIATAGAVANDNKKILGSTGNLPKGYHLTNFQSFSQKPVFIENDANAAAWAEHVIGAGKGYPYCIMLTLGTGVGGGIILDNKLYKGKSGAAGEMHFKMYSDKRRKCTCGAWDCFESYASGTGLKLTAEEISGDKDITTYDVINGLKSQDLMMAKIFERWQDDIINGTIGLANIFDPDCIVFSGSMAEFIDTQKIQDAVNAEIVTQPIVVKKGQAGNYSGMIGVALLALGV